MARTKFHGRKQIQEWQEDTGTLRYDDGVAPEHEQDLVNLGTLTPINELLTELAPPNANSLHGQVLSIYNNTTRKYTGFLATDPTSTYKAGNGAGSQIGYIIKDAQFNLQTPDPSEAVNSGDKGVLELHINDSKTDEFDLAAAFDEAQRTGSQSYTPVQSANGQLTVTSVEKHNNFKAWQKVVALINLAPTDLRRGWNTVQLKHTGLSTDQTSAVFEVYHDDALTTPNLDPVVLSIHDNSNPKFLSGVRFLGQGDQVKVSTVGNALFDNTYVNNPLELYGNGFPTTAVAPTDGSVTGLSNPPVVNETMTVTDKVLTLSVANKCDADARITGRPRDPFGTYSTVNSASQNLLLSTFGNRSSATTEHFDDENYRLPLNWDSDDKASVITGQWDSETLLSNGNAQQFILSDNEQGLLYPDANFTGFQPANTADYSAFSGDQQYLRAFISPSSKTSIELQLLGVAGGVGQVGAGDVNVEVKLPGNTGWLDCAKAFDSSAGVSADGDGCLSGSISYSGGKATINATFGGKATFDSDMRLYVRVTLRNGNRSIKQIATNW